MIRSVVRDIALVLSSVVEVMVAAALLVDPVGALVLHGLASALVLLTVRRADGGRAGFARLFALSLPVLGPVALVAALVALVVAPWLSRRAGDEERRAHLFPRFAADPLEEMARRLELAARSASGDGVVAFADVLRWGDLAQQERVVALMSRDYRPAYAPLFREALGSRMPGLRAQAAAGLSLVEGRLAARAATLRGAWAERGDEADALALADHLGEWANGGLADPARAAALRTEAVALRRGLLARGAPTVPAAGLHTAIGRDLLQMGDAPAAVAALRSALAEGHAAPVLLGWLAEALFRVRDFDALEALVHRHRAALAPLAAGSGPLAPALTLWLEPAR